MAVPEGQILSELTDITGTERTVTVELATAPPQLAMVPLTVYTVLDAGLAVTTEPLVEERFAAGPQVYVLAPEAVKVAVPPGQIVAELTLTVGLVTTVTVTVSGKAVQEPLLPVRV